MSERTIPDVWDVFAKQRMPIRRNSWQKMQVQLNEEEKTVTDLFSDLHIHANAGGGAEDGLHLSEDENDAIKSKHQRHSIKSKRDDERNHKNEKQQHGEWENIEKHLSMKKTIRKKMMRDLQQAFVDGEHDANHWSNVQMTVNQKNGEPNLLDMLKDNEQPAAPAPTTGSAKKPGFWKKLTTRKSKR